MEGCGMKEESSRVVVTLAVFVGIYVCSGPIIGWKGYDVYLKGMEFLAAVIGAGCYWIGSCKR
ncbi:MAG: hypothetical protein IJG56_01225 [Clostridia bacterium]|jgi:hypothetical protein|nr:hypothetical protein [Clostridia bacterium]